MNQQTTQTDFDIYTKVAALGAVAGLRAMMAPALLSYFASRPENDEFENNLFASPKTAVVLGLLAAGEFVGDKLPSTPNRTETLGLTARIFSGALVGGLICAAHQKNVRAGSFIGALSAIAAAFAGQHLRSTIANQTGIPSAVLGIVEDAAAVGIGIKTLNNKD